MIYSLSKYEFIGIIQMLRINTTIQKLICPQNQYSIVGFYLMSLRFKSFHYIYFYVTTDHYSGEIK